jgi:hypothetical protein
MSAENKTIRKLTRLEKFIQKHAKNYDRIDQRVKTMEKGRGVKSLMRGEQRRFDAAFGEDTVAKKPIPGVVDLKNISLTRAKVAPFGFGIEVTFPSAALETWAAPQPGDVVKIRTGQLKFQELVVVGVIDATHIQLEDRPAFAGTETGAVINVYNSTEKKSQL